MVPVKNDRYRMIINLRSLAMLDSGPSSVSLLLSNQKLPLVNTLHMQKAESLRSKYRTRTPIFRAPIKRKVGYTNSDDEIAVTRSKVNNMAMNDRVNNMAMNDCD